VVNDVFNLRGAAEPTAFPVRDRLREEVRVILFLRRGKDQTWIGRGVLGFEILDRLEIAGIGDGPADLSTRAADYLHTDK
jgi:hypothetical protein